MSYELHKQLYDLSGLDDVEYWINESGDLLSPGNDWIDLAVHAPLYNSDYLLEVLPKQVGEFDDLALLSGQQWNAGYVEDNMDDTLYWVKFAVGATALEALLKLAIKLIEDGIWSPKDE